MCLIASRFFIEIFILIKTAQKIELNVSIFFKARKDGFKELRSKNRKIQIKSTSDSIVLKKSNPIRNICSIKNAKNYNLIRIIKFLKLIGNLYNSCIKLLII